MDRVECGGGGGGGVPLRVPLRSGSGCSGSGAGTKKMRKRRELDALAKRCPPTAANGVHKRCASASASGGLSSHDQLLTESSGEDSPGYPPGYQPGYTLGHTAGYTLGYTPGFAIKRRRSGPARGPLLRRQRCVQAVRACCGLLVLACVIATITVMWLYIDIREQVFNLRTEIEQG